MVTSTETRPWTILTYEEGLLTKTIDQRSKEIYRSQSLPEVVQKAMDLGLESGDTRMINYAGDKAALTFFLASEEKGYAAIIRDFPVDEENRTAGRDYVLNLRKDLVGRLR